MTSDEMITEARSIVARLIVACEMDDLEGVVAGVRVLGALFGEPDPDKSEAAGIISGARRSDV